MIKMHMPKLASVRGQTLLTDNKPYLFRQSPVVAEMLDDMLTGGTVAWNQLVNGAGTVTVTNNHKYVSHIGSTWSIAISNGSAISVGASDLVTDLTQMFGSTIADYVYSLEQGTAGSGIAWLKSFGCFTKDYYPYDAGSLLSVKTSGHKMVKNGVAHTYPLSDIELRGTPKLTDGQLYYDGDTYESSGTVTRRFGVVDLGTLTWALNNHATYGQYFYANASSLGVLYEGGYQSTVYSSICQKYTVTRRASSTFLDKTYCFDGSATAVSQIQIKDSAYTDANAFKTAMSGVMLVYELATPTTETTDAFTNPQQAGSTEEYIDERTVPMPVGHATEYFNMEQVEKIQMHMPNNQPIKMHMPTA